MALSEGEQRTLDAIERALLQDDPRDAASIAPGDARQDHLLVALLCAMVGVLSLVTGLVLTEQTLLVGVVFCIAGVGTVAAVGGAHAVRLRRRPR
ncbi:DUF3040 domain-containing protein [Nakamurella sp. GG22]